jgi:hypothetical protein
VPAGDSPDGARAHLHRTEHTLAEGRWDCYVAPRGNGPRTRLTARLVEQAPLVRRPPTADEHGVSAWIPYTTADGFLALRTWRRPAHAEADRIDIGERSVSVTATLYGTAALPAGAEATVRAVSRTDPAHDFSVPAHATGDRGFRFTVPYDEAMTRRSVEHDLWDLRLVGVPGAEPIPVGRIGGDVVDRKKTDAVPAVVLDHPERGRSRVKPFFTVTNDLALSVRDSQDE